MASLCILGNCQSQAIEHLLARMLPTYQISAFDLSAPDYRQPEALTPLLPQILSAELIGIQHGVLAPEALLALKKECPGKIFVFANFYFRGLHPDCCYLGSPETRKRHPSYYHSIAVLDAYARGRSEKKAVAALSYDNFMELGLFTAWETSLAEMKRRDVDVDIPAAELMHDYCLQFPGFLTVNHPTAGLLSLYLQRVLTFVGLNFTPVNLAGYREPFEELDILPIHDFVATQAGLPYRTSQLWLLNHPTRRFLDKEAYVNACYRAYAQQDPATIKIHSPLDLIATIRLSKSAPLLLSSDDLRR